MGQGDPSVKVTLALRSKRKPGEVGGEGCSSRGNGWLATRTLSWDSVQRLLGDERGRGVRGLARRKKGAHQNVRGARGYRAGGAGSRRVLRAGEGMWTVS